MVGRVPDTVCRVVNAQVVARSDGTGLVHMDIELRGTLFMPASLVMPFLSGNFQNDDERAQIAWEHLATVDDEHERTLVHAMLLNSNFHQASSLMLTNPVVTFPLRTSGRVTMHLDSHNRIQAIDKLCGIENE